MFNGVFQSASSTITKNWQNIVGMSHFWTFQKYFQGFGNFEPVRSCSAPPLPAGQITVLQAVATWKEHFIQRGVPEPEHSSQYIIAHLLGAKTVCFFWCVTVHFLASLPSLTHWHHFITQIENLGKGQLTQFLDKDKTRQIWQLCTKRLSRFSFLHHFLHRRYASRCLMHHLNSENKYICCAGCLCSMWSRSGTSEILHWRWDLLCSYRDQKQRFEDKKEEEKNRCFVICITKWHQSLVLIILTMIIMIYISVLFCFFQGIGWSCTRGPAAAESLGWCRCSCPTLLLGSGMWLWCHLPEPAEEPASGQIYVYKAEIHWMTLTLRPSEPSASHQCKYRKLCSRSLMPILLKYYVPNIWCFSLGIACVNCCSWKKRLMCIVSLSKNGWSKTWSQEWSEIALNGFGAFTRNARNACMQIQLKLNLLWSF